MTAEPSPADAALWLTSAAGQRALEAAELIWSAVKRNPLTAAERLRSDAGLTAEQAAEVLSQVTLRALAADRYGLAAADLLLTRDGLEAATRPSVAAHRADLLRRSGANRVVDLTAGLGFDTRAFLAAGLDVISVERDPAIATYLAHNNPSAQVVVADATQPAVLEELLSRLTADDVVFVDPARRDPQGPRDASTARARPERDPERWSPPWSWVMAIEHPRVAAKVSPAFTPPPSWQAQWVSLDRTVVECSLFSWEALADDHSAAIITGNGVVTVPSHPEVTVAAAHPIGAWLHEIDPAVLRANALPVLARTEQMAPLDVSSSWCTSDRVVAHPAVRSHRVIAVLEGSARDQRRQLNDLSISRATVKCRDVSTQPAAVLRDLGLREGLDSVIVVTTLQGRRITIVVDPVQR